MPLSKSLDHDRIHSNVTIVIPVMDRLAELKQTVISIYNQTILPEEIIIVDDGSEIPLKTEHLPKPPDGLELKILQNPVNIGGAKSLDRGIKTASTDYVALLDSDDCYLPDAIEKIVDFWENSSNDYSALAMGFYWCTYDLMPYRVQSQSASVHRDDLLKKGNILGGSSITCVKRRSFLEVSGYPHVDGNHDYALWLRLSSVGKIGTIDHPVLLYRSPTTNIVPTYTHNKRKRILALRKIYKMQPEADRAKMLPYHRYAFLNLLIISGRRKFSLRLIHAIIRQEGHISFKLLKAICILVIGYRFYSKFLFFYAHQRAKKKGKDLLAQHGYDLNVIHSFSYDEESGKE